MKRSLLRKKSSKPRRKSPRRMKKMALFEPFMLSKSLSMSMSKRSKRSKKSSKKSSKRSSRSSRSSRSRRSGSRSSRRFSMRLF